MGQALAQASCECTQRVQSCHRVPKVLTTALAVHGVSPGVWSSQSRGQACHAPLVPWLEKVLERLMAVCIHREHLDKYWAGQQITDIRWLPDVFGPWTSKTASRKARERSGRTRLPSGGRSLERGPRAISNSLPRGGCSLCGGLRSASCKKQSMSTPPPAIQAR